MIWRGAATTQDRIFAALTYLIPILEILPFGFFLFLLLPPLGILFTPIFRLAEIYYFPIGNWQLIPMVVFFALYLGVISNYKLRYFLRLHAMQALLMAVFGWLLGAFIRLIGLSSALIPNFFSNQTGIGAVLLDVWGKGFLTLGLGIIFSSIFIAIVGASIYAIVLSLQGKHAEVPLISEAAKAQVH
jgi:hypothetical protein